MIVVAVLGILAAIVVPQFQEHSVQAREAVARDELRIVRSAIELYTAQNGGIPPGYKDNDPQSELGTSYFLDQLTSNGRYMIKLPRNPFNDLQTIRMIGNTELFPGSATGNYGWVYQPATMTFRMDWPGSDKSSMRYFDY